MGLLAGILGGILGGALSMPQLHRHRSLVKSRDIWRSANPDRYLHRIFTLSNFMGHFLWLNRGTHCVDLARTTCRVHSPR